jgi:glycosyltransferase involved in cell wall biosynthesis
MVWHVLDVRAIWIKEFASALSKQVETLGWLPEISSTGRWRNDETEVMLGDPPLRIRRFPLQRGFARAPVTWLAGEAKRLTNRLLRQTSDPSLSPLICCSPHYYGVAERWPGPVIYYVTDLFIAYGESPGRIKSLERRMCSASDLISPNSGRIADHLIREARCPENKILITPNATRAENLLRGPLQTSSELPQDVVDLKRPVAGVIGNLAANTDWMLLKEVITLTPWLSWILVGSTEMDVPDEEQNQARRSLMEHGGRVRFTGVKPYSALKDYARALDVAILPYRKREPTYSGSSTRFYEHLAACRPMLATRGFEELLHKEPLLHLVDTSEQMANELEKLRAAEFQDGYEEMRWLASRRETWEERAGVLLEFFQDNLYG